MKNRKTATTTYAVNKTVENEANRIAAIDYDSFIEDQDALCVALYASHPFACAKLLRLPQSAPRRCAAETAKALHFNPARIPGLAAEGYFEHQLRTLLEIARKNHDHGAKLVQVFVCMLEHQQEHLLSVAMTTELEKFIVMRGLRDGFLLVEQSDNEFQIVSVTLRRC